VCNLSLYPQQCGSVDQTLSYSGYTVLSGGQSETRSVSFLLGHPVLTVGIGGQGSVVSNPAGISCPTGTCDHYFPANSNVTLSAAAKSGYVFDHWTGACASFGSTCNLSLGTTDVSTTAVFAIPATPAPGTTPGATARPTPTPRPTPTLAPGATPGPTPRPTAGAVAPPPSTPAVGTAVPGQSLTTDPSSGIAGTLGPRDGSVSPGTTAPVALGDAPTAPTADAATAGAVLPVTPAENAGPDLGLLILLVALVLVLGVGIGVGSMAAANRAHKR
jgi:hypothetical protein